MSETLTNAVANKPEPLHCDQCGAEHDPSRVYGEVEICRLCLASAEYRIEQITCILQQFINGGRLESLLAQCAQAGLTPTQDPSQRLV